MKRGTVGVLVTVNGLAQVARVSPTATLLDLLRSSLGLTGAKEACGVGECGACTVLVESEPTLACLVLAAEVQNRAVITIEHTADARITRLRRAFSEEAALQCGFCTPGMILAASRLPPGAPAARIRAALAGNICRCTGYTKIVRAVQRAGRRHGTSR